MILSSQTKRVNVIVIVNLKVERCVLDERRMILITHGPIRLLSQFQDYVVAKTLLPVNYHIFCRRVRNTIL